MKKDRLGVRRYQRFPKAFNKYWQNEHKGYSGINEADDFKTEGYLAWKAGRKYEQTLRSRL